MWQECARSRCRCGRNAPGPGADVGRAGSVPAQMWKRLQPPLPAAHRSSQAQTPAAIRWGRTAHAAAPTTRAVRPTCRPRAAWYPTRRGSPPGVVSPPAWYPHRHGIPTGMVSRGLSTPWQHAQRVALTAAHCTLPANGVPREYLVRLQWYVVVPLADARCEQGRDGGRGGGTARPCGPPRARAATTQAPAPPRVPPEYLLSAP
jgi:hypothetical protein